jgi:hypothetical protein
MRDIDYSITYQQEYLNIIAFIKFNKKIGYYKLSWV